MRFLGPLELAAVISGTATAFSGTLPFPVYEAIPQSFFASDPPMRLCSLGVIGALASSLGLDSESLSQAFDNLPFLNTAAQALRQSPDASDGLAPTTRKLKKLGAAIQQLLDTPEGHAFLAQRALDNASSDTLSEETLEALRSVANPGYSCEEFGDSCPLDQPDAQSLSVSNAANPTAMLPDLLTGFITSKLMGRLIMKTIGTTHVEMNADGSALTLWIKSPMVDVGAAVCEGADLSLDADADPEWAGCGLIALIGGFLSCAAARPPDCASAPLSPSPDWTQCEKIYPDGQATEAVNLTLVPEAEAVDSAGTILAEVVEREGPIYMFLNWAMNIQTHWTLQQGLCDVFPNPLQVVPGWDRVIEVWAREEASPELAVAHKESLPLAILSRKSNYVYPFVEDGRHRPDLPLRGTEHSCDFVLTQRGTKGAYEWNVNFNPQHQPINHMSEDDYGHRGYEQLTNIVIPVFEQYLDEKIFGTGECLPAETTLTITGHSLGGGMTQLYAVRLAEKYRPLGVNIQAIAFAASRGINQHAFNRLLELGVNFRYIMTELDLIPALPCANNGGLPRCDARTCLANHGVGRDNPYATFSHTVLIPASDMRAIDPRFTDDEILRAKLDLATQSISLDKFNMPITLNINVWHTCAYACWFSSKFCTDDPSKKYMCHDCIF